MPRGPLYFVQTLADPQGLKSARHAWPLHAFLIRVLFAALQSGFPVVSIAHAGIDNQYPAQIWLKPAVCRMFARYFASDEWWNSSVRRASASRLCIHFFSYASCVAVVQLNLCQYAHVPIGNLEPDHPLFVSDMLFARSLRPVSFLPKAG
jgi:hypothetical protein